VSDCGVELVRVREVGIEAAAMFESFWTQGTLVEVTRRVEPKDMVLEVVVMSGREDAV